MPRPQFTQPGQADELQASSGESCFIFWAMYCSGLKAVSPHPTQAITFLVLVLPVGSSVTWMVDALNSPPQIEHRSLLQSILTFHSWLMRIPGRPVTVPPL